MDVWEAVTSGVAAVIGAGATPGGTDQTMRRTAENTRAESRTSERSTLEALLLEIEVVEQVAGVASATELPTRMLTAALPGIHHMPGTEKAALVAYSSAVARYNGRVRRLVAHGAAKRAAGRAPGDERPDEAQHVRPVQETAEAARTAVERQLASSRLHAPEQRRRKRWLRSARGGTG